ncbi:MAG: hypothetical protein J6S60_04555 [Oscillospiraceae bacterium]|nr:hypothetical protein [Oscillospiraceae bacterium]
MSLFDSLGQQTNPMQMMQQLRSNPAATLKQAGMNVPDGMTDPQQIVNHLLQSGQISNSRLQMAQRMMGMMRR